MIEPGRKQIYLWSVPSGAQLIEYLLRKGPLCLNHLVVPGKLVRYHIQVARNVPCSQHNFPGVASGEKSPKEGTERA